MSVGAGLYDVVVKSSRSLYHLLMSFLFNFPAFVTPIRVHLLLYQQILDPS